MNPEQRDLAKQYARALQEYIAGRGEAALQEACDMGRKALSDGIGVHGYRLADIFTAELPAPDELRFVRDLSWQPSERLRARLEAEGERWT